jgi:hypothetical protein
MAKISGYEERTKMTAFPKFAKRRNSNRSIDSICTKCFLTVASASSDEELVAHEERHVCDPFGAFSHRYANCEMLTHEVKHPRDYIQAS